MKLNENIGEVGVILAIGNKDYFAGYDAYSQPDRSAKPWVMNPKKVNVDKIQNDVNRKLKKKTVRMSLSLVLTKI